MEEKLIQLWVDEHARLGMSNKQIREHLRQVHEVNDIHIPPPSRKGKKDRAKLLKTGRIAEGSALSNKALGVEMFELDSQNKLVQKAQELMANQNSTNVTHFVFDQGLPNATHNDSNPNITTYPVEDDEDEFEDISNYYPENGITFFDRLVNAYKKQIVRYNQKCGYTLEKQLNCKIDNLSAFEIHRLMSARVRGIHKTIYGKKDFMNKMPPPTIEWIEIVADWFLPDAGTTNNLMIEENLACAAITGRMPKNINWTQLIQSPTYIDIKRAGDGEWGISGIFLKPLSSGEILGITFSEWYKVGLESLAIWDLKLDDNGQWQNDTNPIIVPYWSDDVIWSSEGQQKHKKTMESFYDMIPSKCTCIAATALTLQKQNKKQTKKTLPYNANSPRKKLKPKKMAQKDKTHSLFLVERVFSPSEMKSSGHGRYGSTWSLDHIVHVQGHFRWQPCGKGLQNKKLIWINPYSKGQGQEHHKFDRPSIQKIERETPGDNPDIMDRDPEPGLELEDEEYCATRM